MLRSRRSRLAEVHADIGQGAVFCPPSSRFQGAGSSSTSFTLLTLL